MDLTKNQNYIFLEIEEKKDSDYYLILYTNVDSYGQSIKYNLKTHLSRIKDTSEDFVLFNKDLIIKLQEYLQINIPKDDHTFVIFFEKVYLKLLEDFKNINVAFYYSSNKFIELFEEFTLNTKYLINNFYY